MALPPPPRIGKLSSCSVTCQTGPFFSPDVPCRIKGFSLPFSRQQSLLLLSGFFFPLRTKSVPTHASPCHLRFELDQLTTRFCDVLMLGLFFFPLTSTKCVPCLSPLTPLATDLLSGIHLVTLSVSPRTSVQFDRGLPPVSRDSLDKLFARHSPQVCRHSRWMIVFPPTFPSLHAAGRSLAHPRSFNMLFFFPRPPR